MRAWQLKRAVQAIQAGGIIAYPTEAVYGLGCDPLNPAAVMRLLAIKQRPVSKGLILVAAEFEQLRPYLQPLSRQQERKLLASWPGPVTWLVPVNDAVPYWLHGEYDSIAVRVSKHPIVRQLCMSSGMPLVSTSANITGQPPARSALQVRKRFVTMLDYIVSGNVGSKTARPSKIIDLRSGAVIRAA